MLLGFNIRPSYNTLLLTLPSNVITGNGTNIKRVTEHPLKAAIVSTTALATLGGTTLCTTASTTVASGAAIIVGLDTAVTSIENAPAATGAAVYAARAAAYLTSRPNAEWYGHLLIEPTEQDGPDHHGRVEPEPVEESGALEGDVAGPDEERLSGRLGQTKQVVRRDAELTGAWYFRVPV